MYSDKPWEDLSNKEKRQIRQQRKWEKRENWRVQVDFKHFMHNWNHGNVEIKIEIEDDIFKGIIEEVIEPQVVIESPKEPIKLTKQPRSESLIQAREEYLADMRGSYCLCRLCGRKITKAKHLTIDHKIPLFHGGTDNPKNLQPAHKNCNKDRGSNFLEENAYYSFVENTDVLEIKFVDNYKTHHFVSFTYYLDTGNTIVESVVKNKYKRRVESMTEYNKFGKIMKNTTSRFHKDKYYNHSSLMYGNRKKHQR